MKQNGNTQIKIISKVERPIALVNLDEIIKESDGIMVARGDLGVEIPPQEVPVAQKDMVRRCNRVGKPVIVATQMLESMTSSSRPTRAEANDVFNAVLDGADAVMLSGETAVGLYVVDAVKYMDSIVATAEKYLVVRDPNYYDSTKNEIAQTIGNATSMTVDHFIESKFTGKIMVITDNATNVQMISKYRPKLPILAFTSDVRVARELNLLWGARSVCSSDVTGNDMEERTVSAIQKAVSLNLISKQDHAIIVSWSMLGKIATSGVWMGILSVSDLLTS